jgi:Rieske Fe-S protein
MTRRSLLRKGAACALWVGCGGKTADPVSDTSREMGSQDTATEGTHTETTSGPTTTTPTTTTPTTTTPTATDTGSTTGGPPEGFPIGLADYPSLDELGATEYFSLGADTEIAITRVSLDGGREDFAVVSTECPHRSCPVSRDTSFDEMIFRCFEPCGHDSLFEVSGGLLSGPARSDLTQINFELWEGSLYIQGV